MSSKRLGPPAAFTGVAISTLGYGAFLLIGELLQSSFDVTRHSLRRFVPAPAAVPVAAGAVAAITFLISEKILLRQLLAKFNEKAELVNRRVYWGYQQPWEPERSGSVWSDGRWIALGAQGRVMAGGGLRARDITAVTGWTDVHEPIRIYGGLAPGRSLESNVEVVKREILRTGALRRSTLVIHTSTGTGWVPDWQLDTVDFLTGGNCANVTMQYSYVQSPVAYALDRDTPVRAARLLIGTVLELIDDMQTPRRVLN
ncbi:alpha/beta-hydrolase N-terminal domain-containing protein [Corynebacterium macginleyi]|uniref:alpha/beta-hydrolase N-terminal domain-containing protein n=1 Tax=Corynebacterium macginleyi TaxID=38290 RepID=UPI002D7E904E|nr:alpha/beta-hydrolase N-terminal domain-containing protein [Corynebacterium macginleyi]